MQGKSVVLKQYGSPRVALELREEKIPEIKDDELLVEVKAASINPIDCRMRSGYGKTIFKLITSLPIVLGRDFAGIVKKTGGAVSEFKAGDEVWGVVSPGRPAGLKLGSHSKYIGIPVVECVKKPTNLTHVDAASLPYVALTTWAALITQLGRTPEFYKGKKVLVHAGSGGVGTFAVQFLKQLGATVTTTCSTSNVDFVRSLGANVIIDYTTKDYEKSLPQDFDVVYDLLGKEHTDKSVKLLKSNPPPAEKAAQIEQVLQKYLSKIQQAGDDYTFPKYRALIKDFDDEVRKILTPGVGCVSIVGPMMALTDEHGFHQGMKQYITETLQKKAYELKSHGRWFAYAVYEPNRPGLQFVTDMVQNGKITPHVSKTFSLEDAIAAHETIDNGHVRGKVVIQVSGKPSVVAESKGNGASTPELTRETSNSPQSGWNRTKIIKGILITAVTVGAVWNLGRRFLSKGSPNPNMVTNTPTLKM